MAFEAGCTLVCHPAMRRHVKELWSQVPSLVSIPTLVRLDWNHLPSPARFTPPATSFAPFSMLVETSEIPRATGRPALPVTPST
jgi:hypothetical protein